MAFLDNSGDIILDAVLTDAGRKRLARGDGTFKVTKFAFGDDEVDYGSYNSNDPSGSAYFDLEILQTPILEAFTNNRSSLKSKLISLTNNNLLYLPQLVLNTVAEQTQVSPTNILSTGSFLVTVNQDTIDAIQGTPGIGISALKKDKFIYGNELTKTQQRHIRVDQGLDTEKLDPINQLSAELTEEQYMIQIDNRLGMITDVGLSTLASPSFIDDDQIATYYVTKNVGQFIEDCATGPLTKVGNTAGVGQGTKSAEQLKGPRGTKLRFSIMASSYLMNSDYLFDTIGTTGLSDGTNTYSIINSTIKVTGVTTGYALDIPVTFAKKTS